MRKWQPLFYSGSKLTFFYDNKVAFHLIQSYFSQRCDFICYVSSMICDLIVSIYLCDYLQVIRDM